MTDEPRPTIAYVTPVYPALSETFVYREVLGLKSRGWTVHPVSLHPISDEAKRAGNVPAAELTLYGRHLPATLASAALELVTHPLRSLATIGLGIRDASDPGESITPAGRVRIVGLAVLALALARFLRSRRISHVHCHFANGPTTLGMYASRQLGISWSFTGHANDLFDRRSLLLRKLERAAFVACISEWHRAWYRELCPTVGERCRVIRCGVDVTGWTAAAREARGSGALRVVAVARLVPKKGIDTLIRALADAAKRHQLWYTLRVAGDGPERARLEQLRTTLDCADSVELLGAVPNATVRELLLDADVVALPCRTDVLGDRDGIPVTLMEAMALELPVIAGDLPSIRDLVRDGETGVLVPGDDVETLSDVLFRLSRDPAERRRLGQAGRRLVVDEFSLDANITRLEHALLGR